MKPLLVLFTLVFLYPLNAVMNIHTKAPRRNSVNSSESNEQMAIPPGAICRDTECSHQTNVMGNSTGESSKNEEKDCETLKKYYDESQKQVSPLVYKKPVLVKFSADWCPPCRLMKSAMDDIVDPHKFEILHINYEECGMTSVFNIKGIPQLFRFENSSEMKDIKVPENHYMRGYSPTKEAALRVLLK